MAPLYKRYIPPATVATPHVAVTEKKSVVNVNPVEPPKPTRKRERTQEEVDARKAKKLRSKGVDVEALVTNHAGNHRIENALTHQSELQDGPPPVSDKTSDAFAIPVQEDFSHVKNAKKRHKLQKEARKARKEAVKASEQVDDGAMSEGAPRSLDTASQTEKTSAPEADNQPHLQAQVNATPVDSGDNAATSSERGTIAPSDIESRNPDTPGEVSMASASKTGQDHRQPKKRRHKLESVIETVNQAEDDSIADTDHLKKHAGMLGKFHKSLEKSVHTSTSETDATAQNDFDVVKKLSLPEVHDQTQGTIPSQFTMPAWLAFPDYISSQTSTNFKQMKLQDEIVQSLASLNLHDALPVQQAVIPLLLPPAVPGSIHLPGTEYLLPDVAVSSPTGSGKTVAYLVPILESLRTTIPSSRKTIQALIIVPTQELVHQVAHVASSLVATTNLTVGTATGSEKFAIEQQKLVSRSWLLAPNSPDVNPSGTQLGQKNFRDYSAYDRFSDADLESADPRAYQNIQDILAAPAGHVADHNPLIDILVATPGRLLEHIDSTLGFSLVHLRWLVVDEADKMLDNQSEAFLRAINAEITRERTAKEQNLREKYLRHQRIWDEQRERRVRKVVLSATMTKDVTKLSMLGLRNPKLIIMRDSATSVEQSDNLDHVNPERLQAIQNTDDDFELPRGLVEYCIPVGDGTEKPLVAIELLQSRIFAKNGVHDTGVADKGNAESVTSANSTDDDSSSDESSVLSDESSVLSDESSVLSDESSEISSSTDDDDLSADEGSVISNDSQASSADQAVEGLKLSTTSNRSSSQLIPDNSFEVPAILVFTASNESATRLAHLLRQLKPKWASWISTLTKPNSSNDRRASRKTGNPIIVVSTDRAARGLDQLYGRPITHVLQYDIPRSVTSYVHRVGRTARAGRKGDAWTLYTNAEARWFVNEITKAQALYRTAAVERVKVYNSDSSLRDRYQDVLSEMREEVLKGHS